MPKTTSSQLDQMYTLSMNSENRFFVENKYIPAPWGGNKDELNTVVIFDSKYGAHLPYRHTTKVGEKINVPSAVSDGSYNSLYDVHPDVKKHFPGNAKKEGFGKWIKSFF